MSKKFEVDAEFLQRNFETAVFEADDAEQAEQFMREYIMESFDDVSSVTIGMVKEITS